MKPDIVVLACFIGDAVPIPVHAVADRTARMVPEPATAPDRLCGDGGKGC